MGALIKYEFRKTLFSRLAVLAVTMVCEAFFLYGYYTNNETAVVISVMGLCVLALLVNLIIGIQSVSSMHRDMNTKQGYMLFMTPHSTFGFMGAKIIECMISIAVISLIFLGLGAFDIQLVTQKYGQITSLWDMFKMMLQYYGLNLSMLNPALLIALCFSLIANWFNVVCVAFQADVLSSSLLNGKKFGMLISVVFFFLLNYLVGSAVGLVQISDIAMRFVVQGILYLVISVAMFIVSSVMMQKYLSV